MCFALGKAYEDSADYQESYRYYERGNALKRSESRYHPEVIETFVKSVPMGRTGEPHEIGRLARLGQHQAAVLHRAGEMLGPPGDRRRAPRHDLGLGGGALAPRRQHAAGHPRAAAIAQRLATLDDLDGHATLGKLESAGEAGNAGANDNDGGLGQSITPVPSPA
jgi:hypothetical protein